MLNPFITAVPFWGQTTWNLNGLSPKRNCGSKRVKYLVQSRPLPHLLLLAVVSCELYIIYWEYRSVWEQNKHPITLLCYYTGSILGRHNKLLSHHTKTTWRSPLALIDTVSVSRICTIQRRLRMYIILLIQTYQVSYLIRLIPGTTGV